MVSMGTMLVRTTEPRYRGRVMGLRMMAIYGLPLGLLISGPLIKSFGYPVTATIYCAIGLTFILVIALRWRDHLWRRDAPANRK
jgi:tellurite resistance protein TehA-like permease